MIDYDKKYNEYLNLFNKSLKDFLENEKGYPKILLDSMSYSLNAGGKRVRPVLCLAVADMLSLDLKGILPFALAIEFIHTYSLIHDDLPAMDDDDFRRGKPSNHKVFGEGFAVLAGDSLLNTAFEICLNNCKNKNSVEASKLIAEYAGKSGMIAGQVADLSFEGERNISKEDLFYIIENKTAKLITLPLIVPSVIADNKYYDKLLSYGKNLGFLFQIVDDILDVEGDFKSLGKTLGKDEREEKLTSVSLFGLAGAKEKAKEFFDSAINDLKGINDNEFLQLFTEKMYKRTF